ncbi:MAG: cryptochrome/photolyase family protein [Pseudomonadota bacterium]|nr:cryptochrome/photolyase family protein [Pseudomonadota bacterium]
MRIILLDQLSFDLPIVQEAKSEDFFLFVEDYVELTRVPHHKKKLVFQLSAMRHFAQTLRADSHEVEYIQHNNEFNIRSLPEAITLMCTKYDLSRCLVTEPSEYHVEQAINTACLNNKLSCEFCPDTRFFADRDVLKESAALNKRTMMEFFYRKMRKKTGLLMDGDQPISGQWNYDKDNRKPLPKSIVVPERLCFTLDSITQSLQSEVQHCFPSHIGEVQNFNYAVTHAQAHTAWQQFLHCYLPQFGPYQDAMRMEEPFLFHAVVSMYVNIGLLCPKKLCADVAQAYTQGKVALASAEGFIRQILGWREFIRAIYWAYMPEYKTRNFCNANTPLPQWYWTGKTKMRCLSEAIQSTIDHAYSHHIHRLMITGNFALLAGLQPEEVCSWYWAVYADAYEWVELPNTLGMALHGDGGVVGTKPYIASGAYVNRMSDYCKGCHYDVKQKTGENACPFNYLYWDFLARHQEIFSKNQRMSLAYKNLARLEPQVLAKMRQQATDFLQKGCDG